MFRFGHRFGVPSLLPFLSPGEEGGGASGPAGPGEGATGASGPSGTTGASGPAVPADVQKLIDAAAAAARKEGEKAGKKSAEDAATQAEADAKTKREQDEAVKRGEFDTVKAALEGERDGFKSERDALKAAIESYEKVIGPIVDERLKAVEALGDKDLIAAYPKDADSLTRMTWLDDPRLKPLLAANTQHADNLRQFANVSRTPGANGDPKAEDEAARKQFAQRYG